jgi:hypothetical protein
MPLSSTPLKPILAIAPLARWNAAIFLRADADVVRFTGAKAVVIAARHYWLRFLSSPAHLALCACAVKPPILLPTLRHICPFQKCTRTATHRARRPSACPGQGPPAIAAPGRRRARAYFPHYYGRTSLIIIIIRGRPLYAVYRIAEDGIALAEIIEQRGKCRQLAADTGGSEAPGLHVLAPRDDMSARNCPYCAVVFQVSEGDEFRDIDLIGPSRFRIGDVGEPLQLGRNIGEAGELFRC